MAELATIARPYAEAAFELVDQEGTLTVWSGALANLAEAAGTTEVQSVLGDPMVSEAQLVDTLLAVAKDAPAPVRSTISSGISRSWQTTSASGMPRARR